MDRISLTAIQIARIAAWVEEGKGMADVIIEETADLDCVRVIQGDDDMQVNRKGAVYT